MCACAGYYTKKLNKVQMSTSKKRKIDHERRKFNNEWCVKYFIVQHNHDVVCLICQSTIAVMKEYDIKRHYCTKHSVSYDSIVGQSRVDKMQQLKKSLSKQQEVFHGYKKDNELITKLSFKIAEAIAEKGKLYSDGEFIKNCLEIFIENVSPEKKNLVEQISLSRFTVARRIDDLSENIEVSLKDRICKCSAFSIAWDESTDLSDTAQLVVFIRGVTDNFKVTEEFLDMASMQSTTGQNICEEVTKLMNKFEIDSSKLVGITADGAPSMVGKNNGFVKRFLDVIQTENVLVSHCIIHQESLCSKVLGFGKVMKNVVSCVNFIRSRGLNHRQFKSFLQALNSDYPDVNYFCAVRCLSRAATLKRFRDLKEPIQTFMESKGQDISFLKDDAWLNDFAFLADITHHFSELNVKLQGKDQLVHKMIEHISSFQAKLQLFRSQLSKASLIHFSCLESRKVQIQFFNCEKYVGTIEKLTSAFETRLEDFRKRRTDVPIFAHPFDLVVENTPPSFQLEIIELQANVDLKRAYHENDLLTFYRCYVYGNYTNLENHARKMISLFGSTYCCEQFFFQK